MARRSRARVTRHRHVVLAAIARREWLLRVAALTAAGCGRTRPHVAPSPLTVAYYDNQVGEGAGLFTDSPSQFLVFLPLVSRNAQGELEGRLARSWEHTPDYRTWTVHLRTDVTWHDGHPVTAHDIKFTLDLLAEVRVLPPGAFSVTVIDDSTYSITYRDWGGAGNPLDDYTVYYPKHLLETLDPTTFQSWEFWNHPVGNGPYRFIRQVPRTMMEFEANPTYYRGKPKIDRVVLKFIALNASEVTELLSGNVQAAHSGPFGMLKDDPRFEHYYEISAGLRGIAWNHRHTLFHEPGVRQALTLAINRPELHRVLDLPTGLPICDVVPTIEQMRRGDTPDPLPYDPERAKRLLDAAGWRDGDRDGVRTRNGTPCHFAVLTNATDERARAALYIQAQLRQVGIRMDIQTMDWSGVMAHVNAGTFEAAMVHMNVSFTSPIGLMWLFGPASALGYVNPKVVTLFNRGRRTLDPDEIERIHREAMPIFQADLPVTFLYPSIENMVASRRLRGLSSPDRTDIVWYMEDLWLEE